MKDLIDRQALLEEYDRLHVGEPGRARKLIEDAPSAQPDPCGEMVSREVVVKFFDDWMSALDINCHHQSVADLRIIKGDIKNLPSAQPETHDKRTETNACDLISRKAAIDALRTCYEEERLGSKYGNEYINYGQAVYKIEHLPSAQPEIIRCKDCKFWKKYGYINGKPEFLPKCGFNQIYTSKDDFCSRAERKNNG